MFGVSAALTTPLDENGRIDFKRLNNHAKTVLSEGCDSVTFFGTTGEGASVAREMRMRAIRAALGAQIEASNIILALHGAAADDISDQANAALKMGITRFLLPPPCYYAAPSERGLSDWFSTILSSFRETRAEFILYHIPQVIGVGIPIHLVNQLKTAFPDNVFGVKDSSGSFENTKSLLQLPGLKILVGDERLLAACVRLGAAGAISGIANIFADRLRHVVFQAQKDPALDNLVNTVLEFPVTPAIKALVSRKYHSEYWRKVLPPLEPVSDAAFSKLCKTYDLVSPLS